MKNSIITIASSAIELNNSEDINGIDTDKNLYSDWLNHLIKKIKKNNIKIVGAGFLLKKGNSENLKYILIQDRDTKDGISLLEWPNVTPFMIFCFESPLYARRFYLEGEKYIGKFSYRILLPISNFKKYNNIYNFVTLPHKYKISNENFLREHNACFVGKFRFGFILGININEFSILEILKGLYCFIRCPIYRRASNSSTSLKKLYYLYYLGKIDEFLLAGKNWNNRIIKITKYFGLNIIYHGKVESKENVLKKTKYNLVVENTEIDGYITEKFFDSILMGSIPLVSLNLSNQISQQFRMNFVNFNIPGLYYPEFVSQEIIDFLNNFYYENVGDDIYKLLLNKI